MGGGGGQAVQRGGLGGQEAGESRVWGDGTQ